MVVGVLFVTVGGSSSEPNHPPRSKTSFSTRDPHVDNGLGGRLEGRAEGLRLLTEESLPRCRVHEQD